MEYMEKVVSHAVQLTHGKAGSSLARLDFIWDRFVVALMLVAGAVAMLDNIERLTISSSVECFVPNESNRDQSAFINSFCYRYLPSSAYIPYYLPYFLVIGNVFVVAVHYLWVLLCEGHFRSFFDSVSKLDLHRNPQTGTYDEKQMQVLKRIEKSKHNHWIIGWYSIKAALQIIVLFGTASGTIYAAVISYHFREFLEPGIHLFTCQVDQFPQLWTMQIDCVHTSREILTSSISAMLNIFLFGFGGFVALLGLGYLFLYPHLNELMASDTAKFVFESPYLPEDYKMGLKQYCKKYFRCSESEHHFWAVGSDLEFLVMVLFRSNTGIGKLLRDIQVQMELNKLIHKQAVDVQQYTRPTIVCDLQENLYRRIREQGVAIPPKGLLLITITFGSTRCAYMLYSQFKKDKQNIDVVAINFDPYLDQDIHVSSVGTTAITVIQAPEHIYSKNLDTVKRFEEAVLATVKSKVRDREESAAEGALSRVYLACVQPSKASSQDDAIKKVFTLIDTKEPERENCQTMFLSLSKWETVPRVLNPNTCYVSIPTTPAEPNEHNQATIGQLEAHCGSIQCYFHTSFKVWMGSLEQGGSEQGGHEQGGSEQGGSEQGGSEQGGREQGGSEQGGSEQGGSEQGGREQGGSEQGETLIQF